MKPKQTGRRVHRVNDSKLTTLVSPKVEKWTCSNCGAKENYKDDKHCHRCFVAKDAK
jgi:hypothetical protein